jgi:putative membrane protein
LQGFPNVEIWHHSSSKEDSIMRRMGLTLALTLATAMTIACNDRRESTADYTAGGSVGTAGTAEIRSSDKDFVHDLAVAGMTELELGRLALEHAMRADVKNFAQMMVDDHTKGGEKLKAIAAQHNITFPAQLDDQHRELRDKLANLKGADFDREYMSAMVSGHEDVLDKVGSRVDKETIAEWKTRNAEQVAGKTVEVKVKEEATAILPEKSDNAATMSLNEWAAEAYPRVHTHLEAAKKLEDMVGRRRSTQTQ